MNVPEVLVGGDEQFKIGTERLDGVDDKQRVDGEAE